MSPATNLVQHDQGQYQDLLIGNLILQPCRDYITCGPNPFDESSPEQIEYLQKKLIQPAYERFVKVVANGRQASLTESQVRLLVDGSIYGAPEALNNGLIDEVGYFEKAVETASQLAGIANAEVVRYEEIFSWSKMLQAKTQLPFTIDRNTLDQLASPQLMYLWTIDQ